MSRGRNPGYQAGNHWVICDRCGVAVRSKEIKKTWDGLAVCDDDWEPRHPQDFVRGREDNITPQGPVRPEPRDINIEPPFEDRSGEEDYEIPSPTHTGGL